MNNILEVNGLVKRYPAFSLDNISFSLPEGCVTGFIGANGAGKTTTIRSILNLAHKDVGVVKIFGLDADAYEQEIKDRIGIVMDSNYFYNDLSMKDMKSIVAPAYSKWSDADYRAYMEKFELDPKQKISTLSRGMRMKYALVLALSHQAELLIMDEPTSGLDPLVRSQFLEIVLDYMKNGGKGVFFSTHITSDLDKIADMLILIDGGKIIFQRDKDDLLDTFRTVKGNTAALNDKNKRLIRGLRVSAFGFTGITDQVPEIKKEMPDVLLEKATIEDIMLAAFLGISILIPLLVIILLKNTVQIQGIGMFVFLYMVILMELSFMQSVATEEEKSPKATALLCAAPYPRKSYVIAKYICYPIFYGVCIAIYSIIAAVYSGLGFLNITEALTVFLVGAILYGIYTPIAIKYGITKARLVFTVAILLISLGPTLVVQVFHPDMKLILSLMQNVSSAAVPIILGIAGIIILILSMIISVHIFEKKEL